jgi:DNA-binding NarL/FixJ family response regulator
MSTGQPPLIRVLVVDDHVMVREGLGCLVRQQPDLQWMPGASNLREAAERLERDHPEVLVLDLSLGQDSGLDWVKTAVQRHPQLKILILSMHDELLYARRCFRAGAHGYLMKSQACEEICGAIRRVFHGGLYASEAVRRQPDFPAGADGGGGPALAEDQFSDVEMEIYRLMSQGLAAAEIAAALGIGALELQSHLGQIMAKLGLASADELRRRTIAWHTERRRSPGA